MTTLPSKDVILTDYAADGGETGQRSRALWTVDALLTNAGEVGDGPDQGHSGGADSVPPAPNSPPWRSEASGPIAGRPA